MAAYPSSCRCCSQAHSWEIQTEPPPKAKYIPQPPSEAWSHAGSGGQSAGLCVPVCTPMCCLCVHISVCVVCTQTHAYLKLCFGLSYVARCAFFSLVRWHSQQLSEQMSLYTSLPKTETSKEPHYQNQAMYADVSLSMAPRASLCTSPQRLKAHLFFFPDLPQPSIPFPTVPCIVPTTLSQKGRGC